MDKPDVGPIEGAPPAELLIEDITVGDGDGGQAGPHVSVHYVGVAHSSGKEFDASYNRGEPFDFPLGGGQVIAGWDRGVAGMRVGRPPQADHPPGAGLRRARRRRRDQAGRDAHLRGGPARRAVIGRQAGRAGAGVACPGPSPSGPQSRSCRRPNSPSSNGSPIGLIAAAFRSAQPVSSGSSGRKVTRYCLPPEVHGVFWLAFFGGGEHLVAARRR